VAVKCTIPVHIKADAEVVSIFMLVTSISIGVDFKSTNTERGFIAALRLSFIREVPSSNSGRGHLSYFMT